MVIRDRWSDETPLQTRLGRSPNDRHLTLTRPIEAYARRSGYSHLHRSHRQDPMQTNSCCFVRNKRLGSAWILSLLIQPEQSVSKRSPSFLNSMNVSGTKQKAVIIVLMGFLA